MPMPTIFCFALIPVRKQSTPGFDDFVNDETQVKNRRFKFPNDQFYFKTTAEEMEKLFSDIPESLDNTNHDR